MLSIHVNNIRTLKMRLIYMTFLTAALLLRTADSAADETFLKVVDDFWQWRLQEAPEFASSIDVHTYDNRTEQYTIAVLDDRHRKAQQLIRDLDKVQIDQLPKTHRVSFEILYDTLLTYTLGYEWKDYGPMNPVNFLEGVVPEMDNYIPSKMTTYQDFENYATRLYGMGDQAMNFVLRMRKAISSKTTNHWVSMVRAIPELETLLVDPPEASPFYKPFNGTLENTTIPSDQKAKLRGLAVLSLRSFGDKYQALKTFIETEYRNATRKSYGVSSFPRGQEYYKACLKWHLSLNITPEEVNAKGLQEVNRIYTEMMQVLGRLGFKGSVKEFFASIRNDSRFILKSPEAIIQRFESIINDRVRPKLSKFFKNIPNNRVVVKPMPYDGPGGTYSFGSPDGTRPGVFYANVRRPEDNPTYNMPALVLHEADPGHHLQDIYAQAATGIPMFQKVIDYTKYFTIPLHFPYYTSYTEGWALYAESLGEKDQLDIYQDDYELMGRYSFEIFRACRLVVDTGLHYFNWTRDSAIEYMLNYTSFTRDSIEIEIDRYITWPGQATAYKIGELKIRELRALAEQELGNCVVDFKGPVFDIQEFHLVLLDNGAVPLSVLEKLVKEWIQEVKSKETVEKVSSDFWSWRLSISREYSTTIGTYKYNDRLDSYTYEKLDDIKVKVDDFLKRLSWVNSSALEGEKLISFNVLQNILENVRDGYEWKDYQPLNPINFLELWFTSLDLFVSVQPFDTEGDFVNYVRRIEGGPQQLEEMMNLSRRAIANGHTSHNASVSRVPRNIDDMIKPPNESALYSPFKDYADDILGNNAATMDKRLQDAITAFNAKLLKVKEFLINEYMPKTRPGLGIGSLPRGRENYKACLKFHTSTDMTAKEIYDKGLEEVERIEKLIRKKMVNVGFPNTTSISAMYTNLSSDPKFLFNNPADALAHFNEIIFERIKQLLPKYFRHLPDLPLEVRATVSDGVGGEYWTGSEDGSRPGIFYVNLHRPEDNPSYAMVSLSLHEALPGHHNAESYGLLADIPPFMKNMEWISFNAPYFFQFFNAFSEGWALYSEFLGEEMGIYHDDYEMLGRYSDEMFRAVRLVIDTGIHEYNWTRERAIEYMLNYTYMSRDGAASEVDRYATWPGQATGYKIGEIKFKEVRKKASDALGGKFSLADFHYTVLRYGTLPMSVLEYVVDQWIADQRAGGVPGVPTGGAPVLTFNAFSVILVTIYALI
ncbi:uncharacterized protein LOC127833430 isoform X7 [Dreissena polymorpha]|uniref:uncharacterized protein LOC127833430 isoform X6 n=1 Tax=Dreissena polymorpha TaxID=45954 RepID=UPI00226502A6|nr:uncharacterized protein LOC127833430 isoform X6 [Dreissena polymorpha]XP_052214631.1 uncharacterized protein LOC127833430 isoform X7 [Dreissena polymorpha]